MKAFRLAALGWLVPLLALPAQPTTKTVPPGTPVTISVQPAPSSSPTVTIILGDRHGHATPIRQGFTHTGGGNIDVQQPAPDTVVVTLLGVAVAGGHPCKPSAAIFDFAVEQCLEVSFEKDVKAAKLTVEGRLIGLLRSHCHGGGSAEESHGCAVVSSGPLRLTEMCVPAHGVAGGENLSINDQAGPLCAPISPGKYILRQSFHIAATHPRSLLPCKAASAEFAPDPALDPLWISYWEPFKGAQKKDFGFRVTLKVAPVEVKEAEKNDKDKGKEEGNGDREKAKDNGKEKEKEEMAPMPRMLPGMR
jgi:hypothetical protein